MGNTVIVLYFGEVCYTVPLLFCESCMDFETSFLFHLAWGRADQDIHFWVNCSFNETSQAAKENKQS